MGKAFVCCCSCSRWSEALVPPCCQSSEGKDLQSWSPHRAAGPGPMLSLQQLRDRGGDPILSLVGLLPAAGLHVAEPSGLESTGSERLFHYYTFLPPFDWELSAGASSPVRCSLLFRCCFYVHCCGGEVRGQTQKQQDAGFSESRGSVEPRPAALCFVCEVIPR